jgi:homoserine O-succinyltransferase
MPLIIDGRVPTRWAERNSNGVGSKSLVRNPCHVQPLHVAFINNMPDAALEDTELQFFGLLDEASGDFPICVRLYSLVGVPRGERGVEHLRNFYCDFTDLWHRNFDAAIITGTEPREADLRNEPYWKLLAEVFDWAARETTSALLSCLAAHASVLHNDGITRHRLPDKQFGVFESQKRCADGLTRDMASVVRFPHSRWNEVRESDLVAAGYSVLTNSKEAGVDLFSKKTRRSLFLHCQGHPEYSAETLFKEYRRDVRRFLRQERETYPTLPHGYFDQAASTTFATFRERAVSSKSEEMMALFPESMIGHLQNTWRSSALSIYRGWLQYIASERATLGVFPVASSRYRGSREATASAPQR